MFKRFAAGAAAVLVSVLAFTAPVEASAEPYCEVVANAPTLSGGLVTGKGSVYCYNLNSSIIEWTVTLKNNAATPIVSDSASAEYVSGGRAWYPKVSQYDEAGGQQWCTELFVTINYRLHEGDNKVVCETASW
ncbi:hypothetical protein GCM10010412_041440 [Nonomuraea recticatena]|uniref:Uncharacterized protein n=1 Tax=Nonomuraea recticatena TaxID=46178 RepID=A0ABP6EDQ8_9ACTN